MYKISLIFGTQDLVKKQSLEVDWPMRNNTTEFAAAATIDVIILASFN